MNASGNEPWLHWLFDSLPEALCVKSLDGRLVYANARFGEWYGHAAGAIIGKTLFDLWPREQAERFALLDAGVVAHGRIARDEIVMRTADGRERRMLISVYPIRDPGSGIVGIGTASTEIRDPVRDGAGEEADRARMLPAIEESRDRESRGRMLAEEALQASRRQLQTIADSLPVMIVHYDTALRYQFVNRTYRRWRRAETAEILGRSVEQVVGPTLYRNRRANLERALAGEREDFEYETLFPDGHTRVIRGQLIPERGVDGLVVGVFGVGMDITELKQLERQLVRNERLAAVGKVAATVAHELRTPLGTLASSSTVLHRRSQGNHPDLVRVAERIERNVHRCSAIIDDLMSYTRISEPRLEHRYLDDWVRAWLDEHQVPAGVEVELALHSGAKASFDARRLGQALTNVFDNATQAMLESGIEGRRHRVELSTVVDGARVELIVADNGPGIPPQLRDEVFEPLFSTRVVGVGLGLPLVRQVMGEHQGGADVLETGAAGATIRLWLPVAVAEVGSPRKL